MQHGHYIGTILEKAFVCLDERNSTKVEVASANITITFWNMFTKNILSWSIFIQSIFCLTR